MSKANRLIELTADQPTIKRRKIIRQMSIMVVLAIACVIVIFQKPPIAYIEAEVSEPLPTEVEKPPARVKASKFKQALSAAAEHDRDFRTFDNSLFIVLLKKLFAVSRSLFSG